MRMLQNSHVIAVTNVFVYNNILWMLIEWMDEGIN